jgi:hypothetical protein
MEVSYIYVEIVTADERWSFNNDIWHCVTSHTLKSRNRRHIFYDLGLRTWELIGLLDVLALRSVRHLGMINRDILFRSLLKLHSPTL